MDGGRAGTIVDAKRDIRFFGRVFDQEAKLEELAAEWGSWRVYNTRDTK